MDANTLLWIIGTIIAIILTIIGIWYTKKSIHKPEISLIETQTIYLLSTFREKFKSINVNYNNNPINNNLIYFEATLLNHGKIDIDKNRLHNPIEIIFPENYEVVESVIKAKHNNNINCEINYLDNKLIIKWDLLKTNEYITVETIINSPDIHEQTKLINLIDINHRITDLNKVKTISVGHLNNGDANSKKRNIKKILLLTMITTTLLASILMLFFAIKLHSDKTVNFDYYYNENNKPATITQLSDSSVSIMQNNVVVKQVHFDDINDMVYVKPKEKDLTIWYTTLISSTIYFLLCIIVFRIYYKNEIKDKNLFKNINKQKA